MGQLLFLDIALFKSLMRAVLSAVKAAVVASAALALHKPRTHWPGKKSAVFIVTGGRAGGS